MLSLFLATVSAEPLEIKVWHAYRDAEQEALVALLEQYDETNPDISISPLYIAPGAFASKLEAAVPRGNGPDVFIAAHERIGAWSLGGIVQPLEIDTSHLHPTTVEALTYDGKLFGVPLTFKCLALFVNNDVLKEAPKNTDEIIAFSRRRF